MEFFETHTLFFIASVILAGIVHGALGFGFPLIATPLIALFADIKLAIMLTILPTMSVNLFSVFKGFSGYTVLKKYYLLILFVMLGTVIGTFALTLLPQSFFQLLLAFAILTYLKQDTLSFIKPQNIKAYPKASRLFFGLGAGIFSGTTNVMLPVLLIYMSELGLVLTLMIQVMNLCFFSAKLIQLLFFSSLGSMDISVFTQGLFLALISIIGLFIGFALRKVIDELLFKRIVRLLLYAMACMLCVKVFIY